MARQFFHYTNYTGPWPWKDFTPPEVACKHCGELYLDEPSMDALQALRGRWGKAIVINSGHRCAVHNKSVGGAPRSQHLQIAFDCRCPKDDQPAFIAAAQSAGFTGIGRYPGRGFVHLDMGPKRQWVL